MDTESNSNETEITREDVFLAIQSIPDSDWQGANFPIISYASRKLLDLEYQKEDMNNLEFWKAVLNPEHFLNTQNSTKYDPKQDFLFIIHTFKDIKGEETIVKTITTTPELFIEDPANMIYYSRHGFPCENRGGGQYPTLNNFWSDFYDRISPNDMDRYPIPTKDWRKKYLKK